MIQHGLYIMSMAGHNIQESLHGRHTDHSIHTLNGRRTDHSIHTLNVRRTDHSIHTPNGQRSDQSAAVLHVGGPRPKKVYILRNPVTRCDVACDH